MSCVLRNICGAILLLATLSRAVTTVALEQQNTQVPPVALDVRKLGPQVGERVPDFSLPDQHGEARTLSSLMAPNGVVLVFFRSADW